MVIRLSGIECWQFSTTTPELAVTMSFGEPLLSLFMDYGGAGLLSRGSAEGGAEVWFREGILPCTQPNSRALEMSPRYYLRIQLNESSTRQGP